MIRARRRALAAAVLLLHLGTLWGCDASEDVSDGANESERMTATLDARSAFPLTLEDDAGRDILLEREPRQVVSLVPSATRVLMVLHRGERLVARTDFDDDPELAGLPSVGGGLEPSMERLVSLDPDLVIRFHAPSDPDTPRRLDAAGIPHIAVRPDGIEDILRMVDILGTAVAAPARADALKAQIWGELQEVQDRVRGVTRPRVAYLLGGDPPLVVGGDAFLNELVEVAGADNVFSDRIELYAPVAVEEMIDREVDLLFVTEGASVPRALRQLPVIRVPSEVEVPGPDVGASARRLGRALHPDRFR